jgi:hypothetical protein
MSRHWYRDHQLFGELLRTELRRSEPDLLADLHRRAATWFETEGRALTLDLGQAPLGRSSAYCVYDPRCTFRAAPTGRKTPSGGP